jgi:hypothetical protein
MDDRQRLEAIVSVICRYLPPDGIPINDAMSEIISLVDPLPAPQPMQEPVAWRWGIKKLNGGYEWRYTLNKTRPDSIPLYAAPQKRNT